jgi:hypothetical protein
LKYTEKANALDLLSKVALMSSKTDLFRKVLKRNNFTLNQDSESAYSIKQSSSISRVVYLYYAFAVFMIAFGIFALYLRSLWGFAFFAMAFPLFRRTNKLRFKERDNFRKKLVINQKEISLIEHDKTITIDVDTIEKINYEIESSRDVSIGFVQVKIDKGEYTTVLEMFADDKKYLEYDAKLISQFIADIVNGENL